MLHALLSRVIFFTLLLAYLFTSGACSVRKHLKDDEYLLKKNKVNIEQKEYVEEPYNIKENLALFHKTKPNSNFFIFFPKEWFYYKYKDKTDSTWVNNWVQKYAVESPALYDSTEIEQVALSMEKYLRNKKGYYDATVSPEVKFRRKKAYIQYHVKPERPYTISKIDYLIEQEEISSLVNGTSEQSLIEPGQILDAEVFNQEKNRIVRLLQNNGYANFDASYIQLKGDSTANKVEVFIEIKNPKSGKHQKYYMGKVKVFTDFQPNTIQTLSDTVSFNNKEYFTQREKFFIRPRTLDRSIFIDQGSLYKKSDVDRSYEQLINLGPYRFIDIKAELDPLGNNIVNYNIYLSPQPKKWASNYGTDLFYSTIRNNGQQLFGFSGNISLENSNLTGNAERYSIGAESTLELDIQNQAINTFGLDISNDLQIKRLVDVFGTFKVLNYFGILPDKRYKLLKSSSTTNFSAGYNLSKLLNQYDFNSFNGSLLYTYSPNKRSSFDFRQIDLSYLSWDIYPAFDTTLMNNPLLKRSFQKVLLTSFIFGDLSYYYGSKLSSRGRSWAYINNFEFSGVEVYLLNKLISPNTAWELPVGQSETIAFSKFIKYNTEFRWNQKLFGNQALAYRIRTGIAIPFGDSDAIPFVKQFYIGGPNSLRAWQIRELGPGGFKDLLENPTGKQYYQTGDFIFETNLEYRFPLGWILEGALFVDAGNVWTLDNDDSREDSQLGADFYKQIAIGAGYGIRLDVSFLIIRFDFGYQVRNPYRKDNGSYWPYDEPLKLNSIWKEANFNFGINYPF